jgi:hypothetical protein
MGSLRPAVGMQLHSSWGHRPREKNRCVVFRPFCPPSRRFYHSLNAASHGTQTRHQRCERLSKARSSGKRHNPAASRGIRSHALLNIGSKSFDKTRRREQQSQGTRPDSRSALEAPAVFSDGVGGTAGAENCRTADQFVHWPATSTWREIKLHGRKKRKTAAHRASNPCSAETNASLLAAD